MVHGSPSDADWRQVLSNDRFEEPSPRADVWQGPPFKPVISDLNFAVLDRPEVAVNGSSRLAGMLSHRRRSWEV